jgi:RimJ/RimL family protein N-acetyltransferase
MSFTLRDGTGVEIRPIRPDDKALLARGWALLSRESQQRRFLTPKPRLTRGDLRYLTEVDGETHVALIAVLADRPTHVAGVGRFVRLTDDPETAEFAIVVGDPFQGLGLGARLADVLAGRAVELGIKHFTATVLTENEPIQRLIARISNHLTYDHQTGGVREVVADLAA